MNITAEKMILTHGIEKLRTELYAIIDDCSTATMFDYIERIDNLQQCLELVIVLELGDRRKQPESLEIVA